MYLIWFFAIWILTAKNLDFDQKIKFTSIQLFGTVWCQKIEIQFLESKGQKSR